MNLVFILSLDVQDDFHLVSPNKLILPACCYLSLELVNPLVHYSFLLSFKKIFFGSLFFSLPLSALVYMPKSFR